jgi:hypothetical protein
MSNRYLEKLRAMEAAGLLPSTPPAASPETGTAPGTVARQEPYARTLSALEARCPDYIEPGRWQRAVEDGRRFLGTWGEQAHAFGWTARDLFGLHKPPTRPHPSYSRLSRYDDTGLVWLLEGHSVTALSSETAAIRWPSGSITRYRKSHKPALGPVGDSIDDLQ